MDNLPSGSHEIEFYFRDARYLFPQYGNLDFAFIVWCPFSLISADHLLESYVSLTRR